MITATCVNTVHRHLCMWTGEVESLGDKCPKCGDINCLVTAVDVALPKGTKMQDGMLVRK